jgi:hypothetical protein
MMIGTNQGNITVEAPATAEAEAPEMTEEA